MATAKNIGLKVDEKTIQSIEKLDGKVLISIEGTDLVRIVDEKNLIDGAEKFIDPISSFSLLTKVYTTDAIKPELIVADEIEKTYSNAKAARVVAREKLAALESTQGASKEEIKAAETAVAEAKYAEIAAGQSLVANKEMVTGVGSSQETLEKLIAIRSTPGMDKWNVRRTEAAIKAAEAKIAGENYDYEGALDKIANDEQKFNVWRVEDYKKEIELAKTSGNAADLKAYTRRLNNFQLRLIDQQKAFQSMNEKQAIYLNAISQDTIKAAALSGVSLQEATAEVKIDQSLISNAETSFSTLDAQKFSTLDAQNMTAAEAVTAHYAKQAVRLADPTGTLFKDTNALAAAGASVKQATAYATAKSLRQEARQALDAARQSGDKAAEAAAEAAWQSAKNAEQVAGLAAAAAAGAASAAASNAVTTEVTQAVQEAAAEAAESVTTEVTEGVKDAAKEAQQAALDALWDLEGLPGSTGTHTLEVTAAIRQLQSEMHGTGYNYYGYSSYEETMEAIRSGELNVDSNMNWDYEANPEGFDPNRMGPCGKPSC